MKKAASIRFFLALLCILLLSFPAMADEAPSDFIDYAGRLKFNPSSETAKQEVSVRTFVDGDTTHFFVPTSISESGILKARYLAINTPEITGKVEEYGKKAAEFTREKLSAATSIIIESDDANWNLDSTGTRYLVWVWYKTADSEDYRNLNLEILQNGLARPNSSANNRYGSICMDAIQQARSRKLFLHSGQRDPDFYYGAAIELTLKELRCHPDLYEGKKVAFKGVITLNEGQSVFIEEYDAETGLYFGLPVYYGFGLNGDGLNILTVGNEARIVGTLQFYEVGGTYQVSGLTYRLMRPKDPGNIQKLSDGHKASFVVTEPETYAKGKVTLPAENGEETFDYAYLALGTTLEMRGLKVEEARMEESRDGSEPRAITLTCSAQNSSVQVRLLLHAGYDPETINETALLGKTIDVKGVADQFQGAYQIKVLSMDSLVIH